MSFRFHLVVTLTPLNSFHRAPVGCFILAASMGRLSEPLLPMKCDFRNHYADPLNLVVQSVAVCLVFS